VVVRVGIVRLPDDVEVVEAEEVGGRVSIRLAVEVEIIVMTIGRVVLLLRALRMAIQTATVGLGCLRLVHYPEVHRHLTGEDLHPHEEAQEAHHHHKLEKDAIILAKRMILDGVVLPQLLLLLLPRGLLALGVGVAVVAAVIRTPLVVRPVPPHRLIVAAAPGVAVVPGAVVVQMSVIATAAADAGAVVLRGVRPRGRLIPIRMTRVVHRPSLIPK
jgi:hypothetical protein